MTFCQGNCQGCFFSKEERVSGQLMSNEVFSNIMSEIDSHIRRQSLKIKDDLDISIVLGQGDHLSVDIQSLRGFLNSLIVLKEHNPLIILTTSALIKFSDLYDKISLIREFSREHGLRIVPAVVLDIKKFKHEGFTQRYQDNLSELRKSFGLLDLVINLGRDTVENFSSDEFINFINQNKIRHIEFNFVPTLQTSELFGDDVQERIINWLCEVAQKEKSAKIFHEYNFLEKKRVRQHMQDMEDFNVMSLLPILQKSFESHIYIDNKARIVPAGFGFVGNAVPYHHKNGYENSLSIYNMHEYDMFVSQYAKQAIKNYMQDKKCSGCEFLPFCIDSGVDALRKLGLPGAADCSMNAKKLFSNIKAINNQSAVNKSITNKDVEISGESSFGFDEKNDIKF